MARIKVIRQQWKKGSKLTKDDKQYILENLPESIGGSTFKHFKDYSIFVFRQKVSLFEVRKTINADDNKFEEIEETLKVQF